MAAAKRFQDELLLEDMCKNLLSALKTEGLPEEKEAGDAEADSSAVAKTSE